jgi:hypothetical protein
MKRVVSYMTYPTLKEREKLSECCTSMSQLGTGIEYSPPYQPGIGAQAWFLPGIMMKV